MCANNPRENENSFIPQHFHKSAGLTVVGAKGEVDSDWLGSKPIPGAGEGYT